jgi:hypothetical protein
MKNDDLKWNLDAAFWAKAYQGLCLAFNRKPDADQANEFMQMIRKICDPFDEEVELALQTIKATEDRFPSVARIVREIRSRQELRKKAFRPQKTAGKSEAQLKIEFEELLEKEAKMDEEVDRLRKEDNGLYQVCLFKAKKENDEIFSSLERACKAAPEMGNKLARSVAYGKIYEVWQRLQRKGR